jgi:hypothetical protein
LPGESDLLLVGKADAAKHDDAALLEDLANLGEVHPAQQGIGIDRHFGADARRQVAGLKAHRLPSLAAPPTRHSNA